MALTLIELGQIRDHGNVAFLLESLVSLAAKAGQSVPAFRLLGCAEHLREEIGYPSSAFGQQRNARMLDLARQSLAPEIAEAALAAGRAMILQEAVAYALGDDTPSDAGVEALLVLAGNRVSYDPSHVAGVVHG